MIASSSLGRSPCARVNLPTIRSHPVWLDWAYPFKVQAIAHLRLSDRLDLNCLIRTTILQGFADLTTSYDLAVAAPELEPVQLCKWPITALIRRKLPAIVVAPVGAG